MPKDKLRRRIDMKRILKNSKQRQQVLANACSFLGAAKDDEPHVVTEGKTMADTSTKCPVCKQESTEDQVDVGMVSIFAAGFSMAFHMISRTLDKKFDDNVVADAAAKSYTVWKEEVFDKR